MTRKDELQTELTENDDGSCTLQVQSKRGDDTRNEDRVKATLTRPTLGEIEEQRKTFLEVVEQTMADCRESNQSDE